MMTPTDALDTSDVIRAAALALAAAAILLCLILAIASRTELRSTRLLKIAHIGLPAVSLYKLIGLFGMLLLPLGAVALAMVQLFEGNKEMGACVRCHIMRPMANDM